MGNFGITLDNKFDELIYKKKSNGDYNISLEDLIDLKSSLRTAYFNDNNIHNDFIKFNLTEIDFKI